MKNEDIFNKLPDYIELKGLQEKTDYVDKVEKVRDFKAIAMAGATVFIVSLVIFIIINTFKYITTIEQDINRYEDHIEVVSS